MPTASDYLNSQAVSGGTISLPGVHPSWSPEDTVQYWLQKQENNNALLEAMKSGVNEDNYIDILNTQAKNGDVASLEWLANYYATKDSERTAREWTAQREDTAYQRLVNDLQKAGISPYILSGATPAVSSSSGKSYSGSQLVSRANNQSSNEKSMQNAQLQAILRIAGVIGAALVYAMIG